MDRHPFELRQTSGLTSRLVLAHVEREGGPDAVGEVLGRAGLAAHEARLRDEATWFSFAAKVALFAAAAEVLDDPEVGRSVGAAAIDLETAEGLKLALRALASPRFVYANMVRACGKFSRSHVMTVVAAGRTSVRVRYEAVQDVAFSEHDCAYNRGLLSCVPELFGQPPARVSHPECAGRGAAACVYDVRWDEDGRDARATRALTALGAAALAGATVLTPLLVPVGALSWAAAARRERRLARRRVALLEAEVQQQVRVADRLGESLRDLVCELRVEDVLPKITENAQAAIAGEEFALLVEQDGAWVCRASAGVSASSLAALEPWVTARLERLERTVLVEDLSAVPELAALRRDPAGAIASLCAAPLSFRGETLGVLVSLARHAHVFLPRDVAVLEAYAAQAAIAIANARLFTAQEALATRDPLTGLLNHGEFHEAADRAVERAAAGGEPVAVVLVDLDAFKPVNDTSGHAEGDRVLRRAADALAAGCRPGDEAFRIGGDEFAVLVRGAGPHDAAAAAARLAERVAASDPRIGASWGVACCPSDGADKVALFAAADAALYAMKRERGGRTRLRATAA